MRPAHLIWVMIGAAFLVALAVFLRPQTAQQLATAPAGPAGSLQTPVASRAAEPAAVVNPENLSTIQDPSLDAATLQRAFQPPPPPSSLPPEARPRPSDITPPGREWRQLQREQHAVPN